MERIGNWVRFSRWIVVSLHPAELQYKSSLFINRRRWSTYAFCTLHLKSHSAKCQTSSPSTSVLVCTLYVMTHSFFTVIITILVLMFIDLLCWTLPSIIFHILVTTIDWIRILGCFPFLGISIDDEKYILYCVVCGVVNWKLISIMNF